MFSHLTFSPAQWEECLCEEECVYGTRLAASPQEIISLPDEWLEGCLGKFKTTSSHRLWYTDDVPGAHRVNGPAIIFIGGTRLWQQNDELHREDGPAVVQADGTQVYFNRGVCHRLNGPAVINADGSEEYWVEGVKQ